MSAPRDDDLTVAFTAFVVVLVAAFYFLTASGCVATHAAGIRRMAEAKLAQCRKGTINGVQAAPCYRETRDFCRAHGLERTCGEGKRR